MVASNTFSSDVMYALGLCSNNMFARLETDYEIRNQLFFAILEAALLLFNIINLFYYVLKMFLICFCLMSLHGD